MIEDQHPEVEVVPIHKFPKLIEQTINLINGQWPRSHTARLTSLRASSDRLPTCFVATKNEKKLVIGHLKLTPIPSEPAACFVESVVVAPTLRGHGIGSFLMREAEQYCKNCLKLKTIYLSTYDKQSFYGRLGYEICEPISIFGSRNFGPNFMTKKTYMKKIL